MQFNISARIDPKPDTGSGFLERFLIERFGQPPHQIVPSPTAASRSMADSLLVPRPGFCFLAR